VREAVFSILGGSASASSVLDLYAGTGALGIEALSRGAEHATFVEQSHAFAVMLRRNVEELGLTDRVEVRIGDVGRALSWMEKAERRYDLVLADPPYGRRLAERLIERLGSGRLLAEVAVVFVECGKEETLPDHSGILERTVERIYGETKVAFYRSGEARGAAGKES
jgi:16S rRNA (guanine(966)-N(2))-methyltransferase RsmD